MTDVDSGASLSELEAARLQLEQDLKRRFGGMDKARLRGLPVLGVYEAYMRTFGQGYHVVFQVESVASRGKSIPSAIGLVTAMFMAELDNGVLTAGHDLDKVVLPVETDVAKEGESYLLLNGKSQAAREGDMLMRDRQGILSTVLYGPDARTPITGRTRNAIFTVYAPAGIDRDLAVRHLHNIRRNVLLFSPAARTGFLDVV